MPSGGKINATHAPGRGRELDSMPVEYSEPLTAWIFPRQRTHGSYAVHMVDVLVRVFVYFEVFLKNISWTLEKAKSRHQKNNEQHMQAAQRPL